MSKRFVCQEFETRCSITYTIFMALFHYLIPDIANNPFVLESNGVTCLTFKLRLENQLLLVLVCRLRNGLHLNNFIFRFYISVQLANVIFSSWISLYMANWGTGGRCINSMIVVPCGIVPKLRHFHWWLKMNNQLNWRRRLGTILRGTDPTVSATTPRSP